MGDATSYVVWRSSQGLGRRMDVFIGLNRSRKFAGFRRRLQTILRNGYRRRMMEGKDGRGRPFKPLAPATLKGRPPGPPLMRGGLASRFWRTFESKWIEEASGKWTFTAWYRGFQRAAFAIPIAHIFGATRAGRNGGMWVLPKRDPTGIDPMTWGEVRAAWWDFLDQLTKPGD
jgi:hypothetical protein